MPVGAVGVTLSGSGPTVIAWAQDAEACAAELATRFPAETVLALSVSAEGAH
jgi:homoserine kinase